MTQTTVKPATERQLRYLRALAQKTGTTFTPPRTSRDASREITRMRRLGHRPLEPAERDGHEGRYGSAPDDETVPPEENARPPQAKVGEGSEPPPHRRPRTVKATVIASHERDGQKRQVITVRLGTHRLLIDRAIAGSDARLLARLTDEEPPGNERLIADMYLADPRTPRCRVLTSEDLEEPSGHEESGVLDWRAPLIAGIGATFKLALLQTDGMPALRWHAHHTGAAPRPVTLRRVAGSLQQYEPVIAMSRAAIVAHQHDPACSVAHLRSELTRLTESQIVLNRRLREHVQEAIKREQLSMSEIAVRCGRARTDRHGRKSGETSWLARRIGLLAEAGYPRPTPWVHSDVLALIARDGLQITPAEAETE